MFSGPYRILNQWSVSCRWSVHVFALLIGSCLIWGASCSTSKGSRMPGLPDHIWACLEWHCRIVVNGWHFRPRALLCRTCFLPNMIVPHNGSRWKFYCKSACKALAKGYLLSIFHPLDCSEKARCTWNLVLIRLAGKVLPVPGEETERTELNSLPGFAETASATKCNLKSKATHLPTLFNTRISVQLRFAQDIPLFHADSKRHCIWKRQGKNNSCTPTSLSLSRFSIPLATARVVGALVSSFSGVRRCGLSAVLVIPCRCGAVCPDTSRTSFQAHTVAIRLLLAERVQYGTVLVVLTFLPWECRCFAKKPEMDGHRWWNGAIDAFTNLAGSIQQGIQYAVISMKPARTDVCHLELHCFELKHKQLKGN